MDYVSSPLVSADAAASHFWLRSYNQILVPLPHLLLLESTVARHEEKSSLCKKGLGVHSPRSTLCRRLVEQIRAGAEYAQFDGRT